MNRKAKLLYIFFGLIALFTFLSTNIAYSSAPGVTEPGKRVATRTADANTKKKPAPAKRPSKPKQATPPAVASLPEPIFDSAISQLNMGIAFIEQERYQKALPYIVCSLNQQPGNPDAWYWFGVWNNKTGNFSNAQKYFAKALEIDPNYPALNRIVVYPDDPYEK
ncbi:MAG: tetratricopeptide repeat protein, partial [Synergistaceae bacterium]|nr:tetratricopeptide repeat protein [Synergistaceae bacterium]